MIRCCSLELMNWKKSLELKELLENGWEFVEIGVLIKTAEPLCVVFSVNNIYRFQWTSYVVITNIIIKILKFIMVDPMQMNVFCHISKLVHVIEKRFNTVLYYPPSLISFPLGLGLRLRLNPYYNNATIDFCPIRILDMMVCI